MSGTDRTGASCACISVPTAAPPFTGNLIFFAVTWGLRSGPSPIRNSPCLFDPPGSSRAIPGLLSPTSVCGRSVNPCGDARQRYGARSGNQPPPKPNIPPCGSCGLPHIAAQVLAPKRSAHDDFETDSEVYGRSGPGACAGGLRHQQHSRQGPGCEGPLGRRAGGLSAPQRPDPQPRQHRGRLCRAGKIRADRGDRGARPGHPCERGRLHHHRSGQVRRNSRRRRTNCRACWAG